MASTQTIDVIDVIKDQHVEVRRLLTEVSTARGDALDASFCELRRLIAIHETAEEEVVYPVLRTTSSEGKQIADARTKEEAKGTEVLAKLEAMGPTSAEFASTFETFRKEVLEHAEAEESQVLPLLRSSQTPETLQKMAKTFDLAEKAAPTHAHPHAGTSAVSNLMAGPILAVIDKVRDAIKKGTKG